MKIAIGFNVKNSAWGGGNQFAISLIKEAKAKGYKITTELKDKDIDIILFTDPRSFNEGVSFGSLDILMYLLFINKKAIVVHRLNECDERKNTKYMNKFLKWSNYFSDHNIFIASWLRNLEIYQKDKSYDVILNGADKEIFKSYRKNIWDSENKLKIVTHHWSGNLMKGFDIYKKIDELLMNNYFKGKINFTYIGNLPKNFSFKKARHIKPLYGVNLAKELSKHHVYITASINEPAGMHHIEGALCGLPIIFRNSGALPEYCEEFGIGFYDSFFIEAIEEMMNKYKSFKSKMEEYPYDSRNMTNQYFDIFEKLLIRKDQIVRERNLFRSPLIIVKNFIFLIMFSKKILKRILKIF